jgi:N utilization substance protein A
MTETTSIIRQEILQVADMVAREKGIEYEDVMEAMEQAIQKAGRSKYGMELDIRAQIDRKTGEISLHRGKTVVLLLENEATEISLEEAQKLQPSYQEGDVILDPLPPIDFGRVAAQTARQVIIQRVRQAERSRQFEEYKDKVGEIVNGVVKRFEYGNVTVDLNRTEAIIQRDELIPREVVRVGERIRAYIMDVRPEVRGPQIFLSRTHPNFMAKLFTQEVQEIYDGTIEIKAVARDPGSRAKIGVISKDPAIDPVGACVGLRGSRVQAVVNELQGEKIDIIPWSADPATFVVNALAPAEVAKVVLDDETRRIEVVVPDDQLSLAIGRRGQNVRLASLLTNWNIDITTESDESNRRTEEFKSKSQEFVRCLDVDEVIAHLLVAEGFESVEDILYTPVEELIKIEGFDESVAQELITRAEDFLKKQYDSYQEQYKELGLDPSLLEFGELSSEILIELGKKGIKTLTDFADLSGDELVEIIGNQGVTLTKANKLIMEARHQVYPE